MFITGIQQEMCCFVPACIVSALKSHFNMGSYGDWPASEPASSGHSRSSIFGTCVQQPDMINRAIRVQYKAVKMKPLYPRGWNEAFKSHFALILACGGRWICLSRSATLHATSEMLKRKGQEATIREGPAGVKRMCREGFFLFFIDWSIGATDRDPA